MLTLLVEDIDCYDAAQCDQNHSDPQTRVVTGDGGSCQRNGFLGDLNQIVVVQTEDLRPGSGLAAVSAEDCGSGILTAVGRLDNRILFMVPDTLCNYMTGFIYREGNCQTGGYTYLAGTFSHTNYGLGVVTSANRAVNIYTLFQILGTFQLQVKGEV